VKSCGLRTRNASGEVHFSIQISMRLLDFKKKLVMKIASTE
jgi:hypothetical protein